MSARVCAACGSPQLGPHCGLRQCNWWKCRKCGSVGDRRDGHDAVIDNRPPMKET